MGNLKYVIKNDYCVFGSDYTSVNKIIFLCVNPFSENLTLREFVMSNFVNKS